MVAPAASGQHRRQPDAEPRGAVPLPVPSQGADRLLAGAQVVAVDRRHDAAVAHHRRAERHVADAHRRPGVLGEGLATGHDDVGPEPLVRQGIPGLLTPLERRLEHPVVEARERRLRRDVERARRPTSELRSPSAPPRSGRIGRCVSSSCHTSRSGRPTRSVSQPSAPGAGGSSACPAPRTPPARARRRGAAPTSSGSAPGASSRTPPPSSGSARSPRRACSSRAVTLVPSGSTTAHRRSPRSPRASTTAASTLTPPSDLTGYAVSDVT